MKTKKSFALTLCYCIVIVLSITVAAQASTVNFDFTGISWFEITGGRSLDFTQDGLELNVSATSGNYSSWVNWSPLGLGVSSWLFDNPEIDGIRRSDFLLLSFDQEVTISSSAFTLIRGNSDFRLFVDGVSLVSDDIPGSGVAYSFSDLDSSLRTGRNFGFTVADWNDHFRIAGVTVEVSHAPIPPGSLLFVSSLAGLLIVRKKCRVNN